MLRQHSPCGSPSGPGPNTSYTFHNGSISPLVQSCRCSTATVKTTTCRHRRRCTTCSPTDTTGLTVVLLLVPVKQVTHVAVVLPKLQVALFARLLHLKHQQTVRLLFAVLLCNCRWSCVTLPDLLHSQTLGALHLLNLEAVQLVELLVIVAQSAHVQFATAGSLQTHNRQAGDCPLC